MEKLPSVRSDLTVEVATVSKACLIYLSSGQSNECFMPSCVSCLNLEVSYLKCVLKSYIYNKLQRLLDLSKVKVIFQITSTSHSTSFQFYSTSFPSNLIWTSKSRVIIVWILFTRISLNIGDRICFRLGKFHKTQDLKS